jgi:hypothetical protein
MAFRRGGGLSGKARLVHVRSRAARAYASERIAEWSEPDKPFTPWRRFVPVGRRAEFMPSIDSGGGTPSASAPRQLELPLVPEQLIGARSRPLNPTTEPRETLPSRQHFGRLRSLAAIQAWRASPGGRFSILQFLKGCFVGSAAAAVVLSLLYWLAR